MAGSWEDVLPDGERCHLALLLRHPRQHSPGAVAILVYGVKDAAVTVPTDHDEGVQVGDARDVAVNRR